MGLGSRGWYQFNKVGHHLSQVGRERMRDRNYELELVEVLRIEGLVKVMCDRN